MAAAAAARPTTTRREPADAEEVARGRRMLGALRGHLTAAKTALEADDRLARRAERETAALRHAAATDAVTMTAALTTGARAAVAAAADKEAAVRARCLPCEVDGVTVYWRPGGRDPAFEAELAAAQSRGR